MSKRKLLIISSVVFMVGGSLFWATPGRAVNDMVMSQTVCANDAGEQKTFNVGWRTSIEFFKDKGSIAALFCKIASQGYTTFVSTAHLDGTALTDAELYYNGVPNGDNISVVPAPVVEPTPAPTVEPTPQTSDVRNTTVDTSVVNQSTTDARDVSSDVRTDTQTPTINETSDPAPTPSSPEPTVAPEPVIEQPQPVITPIATPVSEPSPSVESAPAQPEPVETPEVAPEPSESTPSDTTDTSTDITTDTSSPELVQPTVEAPPIIEPKPSEPAKIEQPFEQPAPTSVSVEQPQTVESHDQVLAQLMDDAQKDDPQLPTAIASIPLLGNVASAVLNTFNQLGNVGADMTPQTRAKAKKEVIAAVIVTQVAGTVSSIAAGASSGASAARRKETK